MKNNYDELFHDHWKIAEERYLENFGRLPTFYEKLEEFEKLMDYFYEDCNASFLILFALASPYLDFNFLI